MLRLEDSTRRLEAQVHHLTALVKNLQEALDGSVSLLGSPVKVPSRIRSSSSSTSSYTSVSTVPSLQSEDEDSDSLSDHSFDDFIIPSQTTKRARLLIDGTWLYYSLYERQNDACPIARRFGVGWPFRYTIDWNRLPRILEKHIASHTANGQDAHTRGHIVQIESISVFTSYKADTSPSSFRYKMYKDMKEAGYDVHMMETLGRAEKCVDIALAVELLQSNCDIALLLTGDKDFLPAMIRARSPQKEIGLVSMKIGCNRALYEPPSASLLDYNVIWLDEYVDQFVVPKVQDSNDGAKYNLSILTFIRILNDFIEQSSFGRVSARDVGRYLKFLRIDSSNFSDELKASYGSLRQLLRLLPEVYRIVDRHEDKDEKGVRFFLIEMMDGARQKLHLEAQKTELTDAERRFFDGYSLKPLEDKTRFYLHTIEILGDLDGATDSEREISEFSTEIIPDYSKWTVAELKQHCREQNLPVSGNKSVLIERVETNVREESGSNLQPLDVKGHESKPRHLNKGQTTTAFVPVEVNQYLKDLLVEYLQASGGRASSRDVGRYLAANKSSTGNKNVSALVELKSYFSGVLNFLHGHSDTFRKDDWSPSVKGQAAFTIVLADAVHANTSI